MCFFISVQSIILCVSGKSLIPHIHSHNLTCSGAGLNVCPVINMVKYSIVCVSRVLELCIYMRVYVTMCVPGSNWKFA